MIRVAVCLSGEPRTWAASYKNILEFFNVTKTIDGEAVEVDYFIHTWRGNSWREGSEWNFETLSRDAVEPIGDVYKAKAFVNQPPKFRTTAIYGALFESQRRSFMLKRDYELEHGFEYDVVVKARLDIVYEPGRKFNVHKPMMFSAYTTEYPFRMPREYNASNFSEVLFYGDSPTMDLIGDTHIHALRDCSWSVYHARTDTMRENIHMKYGPGAYMSFYMGQIGISSFPPPNQIIWAVVRKEAQLKGLDPIDDYDEIRDIHIKFY